jgi:hypothetical protein
MEIDPLILSQEGGLSANCTNFTNDFWGCFGGCAAKNIPKISIREISAIRGLIFLLGIKFRYNL